MMSRKLLKLSLLFLMILIIPIAVHAQLNATPVGYWRFEDNSSAPTVFDSSPNGNDGVLVADAFFDTFTQVTNETGIGSTEYDGADDRIDVLDADNDFVFGNGLDDQPFSAGAWINMDDATGFRIISKRASNSQIEWSFFTTASDLLNFMVADDDNAVRQGRTTDAVTSLENIWIHVVGTYDGSESSGGISIYIDGVISDTANDNAGAYTAMDDSDSNLTIGVINTVSAANGHLDEVFVVDFELTELQVNEIMNNGFLIDDVAPSIINCQVNNTALTCNDVQRFSCNVTDANIDSVFFGFDDLDGKNFVNVTINKTPDTDIFFFEKQYTVAVGAANQTYNFTNATATDIAANLNVTILNIPYNYSCTADDITPPVIITSVVNNSIIDRRITNQTVNFTVTDNIGIKNITVILFNASDSFFNITILLNASETTFTLNETVDISGLATGFYFVNRIAFDTSNNTAELLHRFLIIDFDVAITLDAPSNNSLVEFFDSTGQRFTIDYRYTVATEVVCNLFLNDTFQQSQNAVIGQNTFSLNDFDVNQTIRFNVGCDFTGTPLNSSFHVFAVEIQSVFQLFQAGVCRTDTGSVLLLALFILIAFLLIGMGLATRIGFIGLFGSLLLLFTSLFLFACAVAIGTILALLSLLFFFLFIFRSFFPNMFSGTNG